MEIIFWILIGITGLLLALGIFCLFMKKREHGKLTKQRIDFISNLDTSDTEQEMLTELANRTHVVYYSYEIHTMIYMFCNVCGLLFTIAAFLLSLNSATNYMNIIVSFFSIVFVIIIIYVRPQRRSTQFLLAWRRLNHGLLMLLYGDQDALIELRENEQRISSKSKYVLQLLSEVENSFVADEDNN